MDTILTRTTNLKSDRMAMSKKSLFSRIYFVKALILMLLLVTSCESQKTIVNGLEEKDANEILVFLSRENIQALKVPVEEKGGGGGDKTLLFDIVVPSSQALDAMAILSSQGLPRRRGQNLLNLFKAAGLVPSEMQDRIRYQAGLAEQIASTIRKIDGVLDADVQLSFPEEDPLNPKAKKEKVSSSVYVKHQGVLDDPNSQLISKIKRLVASSVNGLSYDDVTVIADRARFSEISLRAAKDRAQQGKIDYVQVWSIILAKTSLRRFQTIFFSFSILIIFLVILVAWMSWKVFPLLRTRGGIKTLFSIHPIPEMPVKKEKKQAKKKKEDEEEEKEEGEEQAPEPEEEKQEETKEETPPPEEEGVQENVEAP